MSRRLTKESVEAAIRLLDEAFMSWSLACCECRVALQAWFDAPREERAAASCAYRAALDREEAAARYLEHLTTLSQAVS
jgi:hypothetical protein